MKNRKSILFVSIFTIVAALDCSAMYCCVHTGTDKEMLAQTELMQQMHQEFAAPSAARESGHCQMVTLNWLKTCIGSIGSAAKEVDPANFTSVMPLDLCSLGRNSYSVLTVQLPSLLVTDPSGGCGQTNFGCAGGSVAHQRPAWDSSVAKSGVFDGHTSGKNPLSGAVMQQKRLKDRASGASTSLRSSKPYSPLHNFAKLDDELKKPIDITIMPFKIKPMSRNEITRQLRPEWK